MKKCSSCKLDLDNTAFYSDKRSVSGLTSACRKCHQKRTKRWVDKNKEKVKQYQYEYTRSHRKEKLNQHYKRKYGITMEAAHLILSDQEGRCCICGTNDPGQYKWDVDHCHDTGTIRGVLCHLCNAGLGFFRESPEALRKAAIYLEKYNGKL